MKNFLALFSFIALIGCQNDKKEFQPVPDKETTSVEMKEHEGRKLMETHCYLCHSPNAGENEGRIAPPMVAIKARYIDKDNSPMNRTV